MDEDDNKAHTVFAIIALIFVILGWFAYVNARAKEYYPEIYYEKEVEDGETRN